METIDRVKALVGDQIGLAASEIDAETPFKELDLDSLDRIELGMAIEEHFHLDIPDKDMEDEAHGSPAGIAAYLDGRKADWGTFTGKGAPDHAGVGVVEKMKTAQEALRANVERANETWNKPSMTNGQPTGIEGKSMPIYGIRKADFDDLRALTVEAYKFDVSALVRAPLERIGAIIDGIAAEESKSRGYKV